MPPIKPMLLVVTNDPQVSGGFSVGKIPTAAAEDDAQLGRILGPGTHELYERGEESFMLVRGNIVIEQPPPEVLG